MEVEISQETDKILLSSREILSYIRDALNDNVFSTEGHDLDDNFFGFKNERYPMFFTDNKPVDRNNIGKVLPYLLKRIPKEFFSTDKNIEIVLSNDTEMFKNNINGLKTAPSRRRWYFIEEKGDTKTIYWHIRDNKLTEDDELVGGTDAIEMMSFLSLLHILRKAGFEKLKETLEAIEFSPHKEGFETLDNSESFENWKKNKIKVRLDFDENRQSAVDILIKDLEEVMPKLDNGENKPFLLIGNDFSWRLTMFTIFLNGEDLEFFKKKYEKELDIFHKIINEKQLDKEKSLKDFIEKYYLLTLLNKNYSHDDSLKELYERIFSPENYSRLGYKRLLYGIRKPLGENNGFKRSILGEPVDYWDPESFDEKLLENESGYIKDLFTRLIKRKQPILSIPYLNGKISPELVVKLIKKGLINDNAIGFLGKVGFFEFDKTYKPIHRGDIVVPSYVREITGSKPEVKYPNFFYITEQNLIFLNLFTTTLLTTTPAVTTQDQNDFECNTAIDSEQYHIIKAFEEYDLKTKIIGSFYISDISRRNPKIGANDNINRPLSSEEGTIAVCLTTLFEIDQILKFLSLQETSKILSQGILVL